MSSPAPQFWLWFMVGLAAFGVFYWRYAASELANQKAAVMARQRAVRSALAPKIYPFRDRAEKWVMELAGKWDGSEASADVDLAALGRGPGVYLRLRMEDATSPEAIREAGSRSVRDGFTSCLFVGHSEPDPSTAPACRQLSDCEAGFLCNDYGACARPGQPFNLRLVYRALRVLEPEWADALHQAPNDLAVRAFEHDLEKVAETDVPLAADLLVGSRYVTVLLDETPDKGLPPAVEKAVETEREESEEERLQRTPHWVRIGVWNVESGETLLKLRVEADAKYVPVGEAAMAGARVRAAQQRQVNNCGLALSVKEYVGKKQGAGAPPPTPENAGGAPAPVEGSSAAGAKATPEAP
jgi:hypothetical protein